MTRENGGLRSRRLKVWIVAVLVMLAVAGYYAYRRVSMGEDWGVFRAEVAPSRRAKIERRMDEITSDFPSMDIALQVADIDAKCLDKRSRVRLQLMGLAPVPHIEEMTRSRSLERRLRAFDMLHYVSPTGTPGYEGPLDAEEKSRLKRRYLWPIWERALNDVSGDIRLLALKHWDKEYHGAEGIEMLQRMLRDPDRRVCVTAARMLIWLYSRPDLVPKRLQTAAEKAPTY